MKSNQQSKSNSNTKAGNNSKSLTSSSKHKSENSSKQANGLRDLMEDSLKDIYWAEKALVKALPKMAENASSEELVNAIEEHLDVTKNQVEKLEKVFEILNKTARAKKCEAMEGLIKEGETMMEETEEGVVRDAAIIAASQKIEHYEIASYGTLCAFAKTLGEDEVVNLLEEILDEEKEADVKLSEVAESSVNLDAAEEELEEMETSSNSGKKQR